jgi:hypothetical protein
MEYRRGRITQVYRRWCSDSSRNVVRLPFGNSVRLRRNPHLKIVEREIDRSNAAVPGDDKIGSCVGWWFAGSARYPSNPSGHHLIPREGRGADIRNLGVLLLSHQQYDQSRLGHEIYRLWGHRILHLHERSRRLQRDDARGHFRRIRRSDYEAARSMCCWTSCSPFQIVGREPPEPWLIV